MSVRDVETRRHRHRDRAHPGCADVAIGPSARRLPTPSPSNKRHDAAGPLWRSPRSRPFGGELGESLIADGEATARRDRRPARRTNARGQLDRADHSRRRGRRGRARSKTVTLCRQPAPAPPPVRRSPLRRPRYAFQSPGPRTQKPVPIRTRARGCRDTRSFPGSQRPMPVPVGPFACLPATSIIPSQYAMPVDRTSDNS